MTLLDPYSCYRVLLGQNTIKSPWAGNYRDFWSVVMTNASSHWPECVLWTDGNLAFNQWPDYDGLKISIVSVSAAKPDP